MHALSSPPFLGGVKALRVIDIPPLLDEHLTPASRKCPQSCTPIGLAEQLTNRVSEPEQWTSSSQIDPVPGATPEVNATASGMSIIMI